LTTAVLDIFPRAERRECFRHLMQNYIKQIVGNEFMYPTAQAYKSEMYAHHMVSVASIPDVIPWIKEHHKLTWYMSGFNPAIKCDYITNNIADVFNNWIKDYKDLPVCELADKIRVMLMKLLFRRRRIREKLNRKILPSITNILNAKTRGLDHLSLAKGDHYCVEVQDNNNGLTKHIVKADLKFCSCLEWQHTDNLCQHALVIIIAQSFRDVSMEQFVDDYFSVEKFKKAYTRRMEQLADRSFWPQVEIASDVGAPLGKRVVDHQRKNRIKGCLEGGSGNKLGAKATNKAKPKAMLRGKFKCPNCHELGHRKNSLKCPLGRTKKR
jgi:hypothetical protein